MRSRFDLYQQGVEDAFSSWIAALRRAYSPLEEFTASHEFIAEMEGTSAAKAMPVTLTTEKEHNVWMRAPWESASKSTAALEGRL